jgi:MFS family permease
LIGKPFLMAAFPLWGANISAAYVALNTLVNSLPPERQVKANGMYRAVSSGISVVAPMLATAIASKLGNGVSIVVFGSGMCTGAVLMYWYPSESEAMSGKKQTPIGWLGVLKQPGLLRFMVVDQWFALGTTSISAFQTLRLARDLELGDSSVGVVISSGLGFNFLGTLAAAPLQERFSERIALAVAWFTILIGALFLSLSTAWWTAAIGVCAAGFGSGLYMAPSSVTIARLGGGSPNAAKSFTIWKVAQGTTWVVSMQICAALEASVGMATTIGIGALLSVLPWLLLLSGRVQLEVPSPESADQ